VYAVPEAQTACPSPRILCMTTVSKYMRGKLPQYASFHYKVHKSIRSGDIALRKKACQFVRKGVRAKKGGGTLFELDRRKANGKEEVSSKIHINTKTITP
jgi:hypothetical protein